MPSMNQFLIVGRLVADPELRYTPAGKPICKFCVAVDRPRPAGEGVRPDTDFFDCTAFSPLSEFAGNFLAKGRLVGVAGKLHINRWTGNDGIPRRSPELICHTLQALDSPKKDDTTARPDGPPTDQQKETVDPFAEPMENPHG